MRTRCDVQGTTTNGRLVLPFKTGAFLAGVPVQPCMIKYETGRVSPSWDSIDAVWHIFLMLAELTHQVTVYLVPPPPFHCYSQRKLPFLATQGNLPSSTFLSETSLFQLFGSRG